MSAILAAFINGGIAATIVTLAMWIALSVAPRRALNAATRYALWWAALILVVVLPAFYLPRPSHPIPVVATGTTVETPNITTAVPEAAPVVSEAPPPSHWPQFPLELSVGRWAGRIFAIWSVVAVFMFLRLAASYAFLELRKRRARPVAALRNWSVRALASAGHRVPRWRRDCSVRPSCFRNAFCWNWTLRNLTRFGSMRLPISCAATMLLF